MKNIVKAVTAEEKKRLNDFINEVNEVQSMEQLNNWRFNNLLPKGKKMSSFNSLDAAKAYLIARKEKKAYKQIEREVEQINAISAAGKLISAKISVEWKRSATWGANPTAEAWIRFINKDGQTDSIYLKSSSIGGCGYDKLSTAIAEALNQSNEVLKPLYLLKNKNIEAKNHELIGYGSGYGIKPKLEGGVGVSCYPAIFNKIGFDFKTVASGKTYDVYEITKK